SPRYRCARRRWSALRSRARRPGRCCGPRSPGSAARWRSWSSGRLLEALQQRGRGGGDVLAEQVARGVGLAALIVAEQLLVLGVLRGVGGFGAPAGGGDERAQRLELVQEVDQQVVTAPGVQGAVELPVL